MASCSCATFSYKITEIGPDAFRTQDGPGGWGGTGDEPKLYFVGAMYNNNNEDTVPFQYAMNGSSKIMYQAQIH